MAVREELSTARDLGSTLMHALEKALPLAHSEIKAALPYAWKNRRIVKKRGTRRRRLYQKNGMHCMLRELLEASGC